MSIAIVGTSRFTDYELLVRFVEEHFMCGSFAFEMPNGGVERCEMGVAASKRDAPFLCERIVTGVARGVDAYAARFAANAMVPCTRIAFDDQGDDRHEQHALKLVASVKCVVVLTDGESRAIDTVLDQASRFAVPCVILNFLTRRRYYWRCMPLPTPVGAVTTFEPEFRLFTAERVLHNGAVARGRVCCCVRFFARYLYESHRASQFDALRAQWQSLAGADYELEGALVEEEELNSYCFNNQYGVLTVYNFEAGE